MGDRGVAHIEFRGSPRAGYARVTVGDIFEILHRGEDEEDSGWLYVKRACTHTNVPESGWVPADVLTDLSCADVSGSNFVAPSTHSNDAVVHERIQFAEADTAGTAGICDTFRCGILTEVMCPATLTSIDLSFHDRQDGRTDSSQTLGNLASADAQSTVCRCIAAFTAPEGSGYLRTRLGDQVDVLYLDDPWVFAQRTTAPFDRGWLPVEIIERACASASRKLVPTQLQTKYQDVRSPMDCQYAASPKTTGDLDFGKGEVVNILQNQKRYTVTTSVETPSLGSNSPWQSAEKRQSTENRQSNGKMQSGWKSGFAGKANYLGSPCSIPKHGASKLLPHAVLDTEGRHYNWQTVVVNFANVGGTYAEKVLKKSRARYDRMFDWEGVRKCVQYLSNDLDMRVIGVVFEKFKGPDNENNEWCTIPKDIQDMCSSVQETPNIIGSNHMSADDEMTIKCAYWRNCRFMDNDNYRDWRAEMHNDHVRL